MGDAIQTDAAINPGNSGGAIPVDEVKSVSDQLAKGVTPKHAVLGVSLSDEASSGALIAMVSSGSAADTRAALRVRRFSGNLQAGREASKETAEETR